MCAAIVKEIPSFILLAHSKTIHAHAHINSIVLPYHTIRCFNCEKRRFLNFRGSTHEQRGQNQENNILTDHREIVRLFERQRVFKTKQKAHSIEQK